MAIDASQHGQSGKGGKTGKLAVLQIYRSSTGKTSEMTVFSTAQDVALNMGDKIMCVDGMACVLIKPGSPSGAYIVSPQMPLFPGAGGVGKHVTVLEINEETVKARPRGKIWVGQDIGNTSRGTGGTTR